MNRTIPLLIAALAFASPVSAIPVDDNAPPPPTADAPAQPKAVPPPNTPVVQLGDAKGSHCTAFFLGNPDLILTAGHCLFLTGIALDGFVILPQGRKAPDGLLSLTVAAGGNPNGGVEDWAIFRIDDPIPAGWKGVTLDCHYIPQVGAEVYSIGFPAANGRLTLTRGYINGSQSALDAKGEGLIPVTMPVSPGASGSPVFEPDGRVVGILTDENPTQDGWSYYTSLAQVCSVLHLNDASGQ